jgi:transcriptional regulator with XRE-family HTH domain
VSDAILAAAHAGNVGDVVRLSRRARGLSQQDLGKRCKLSQPTLSRIERSKDVRDVATLRILVRELDIPPTLVGLADQPAGFAPPKRISDPAPLAGMVIPPPARNESGEQEDPEDVQRREFIATATAAVGLPLCGLLSPPDTTSPRTHAVATPRYVGRGDCEAVREMTSLFSRADQRLGGGHARTAVAHYLGTDITNYLHGSYVDDHVRREMFAAVSELAYLAGWMAFDDSDHRVAQHRFSGALQLATEAEDQSLRGHILRAMAHQALDLGYRQQGLDLAAASVERDTLTAACPRERALIGVVHARALAATGQQKAAAVALRKAEDHLAAAAEGDDEPARVFFFGEASLAHETARTLLEVGDLPGAIREFRNSVAKRQTSTFARTHVVTLGYLGAAEAANGRVDAAHQTWTQALHTAEGIRSGRVRKVVKDMYAKLSALKSVETPAIRELRTRAAAYLAATRRAGPGHQGVP